MVRDTIKDLGMLYVCVLTKIDAHCGNLIPDAEGSPHDIIKMINKGN